MATTPEEPEPQEPIRERVARAVSAPTQPKNRPVTLLAISATLAALAPFPAGPLAAGLIVLVAADRGRR